MCEDFIGKFVSIDCGDVLGVYQGKVSFVDKEDQSLSIVKPFRNGARCEVSSVTISASDIKGLNIIENVAPVYEHQKLKSCSLPSSKSNTPRKKKDGSSRDGGATQQKEDFSRQRSSSESGERSLKRNVSTPRKMERQRARDSKDDCFSAPVESFLEEDFDFEKNLALFDKQAVFEEIENSMQPDVIRNTDTKPAKYRCDENVLPSGPVVYKQIKVSSEERGTKQYVTDCGLVIPSITYTLKEKIQGAAERFGFVPHRQLEAMGRSIAEMVLQLIGGSHRLAPQNSHQKPTVVVLCGSHIQGAQALNCARHLKNRQVSVTVFVPDTSHTHALIEELHLYEIANGKKAIAISDLPKSPVDIIINAIDNQEHLQKNRTQSWYSPIVSWANQSKASVLALDPPSEGSMVDTKWSVTSILPLSFSDSCGKVYLCDVGFPEKVFEEVGIKYMSPFGPKFYIPLHLNK